MSRRYNVGNNVVVQTIKPVKKGEPIYENYGPLHAWSPKEERLRYLKGRYWFECNCQACREDWPTFETIPEKFYKIRCKNAKCCDFICFTENFESVALECKTCGTSCNLLKVMRSFDVSIYQFRGNKEAQEHVVLYLAKEKFK